MEMLKFSGVPVSSSICKLNICPLDSRINHSDSAYLFTMTRLDTHWFTIKHAAFNINVKNLALTHLLLAKEVMTIFEILPLTITLVCISRKGRVFEVLFIQAFLILRNSGIPYQNSAIYFLVTLYTTSCAVRVPVFVLK